MADKPVDEIVQVDAVLDALVSPTSSDVYEATLPFSAHASAAAAARRALTVQAATVPLTDAQIRGLAVTPVTVIPAPAASEGFVLLGASLAFHVPDPYTADASLYLAATGVSDLSGGDYFASFSPAGAFSGGGTNTVIQAAGFRATGPIAGLAMVLRMEGTITDGGAGNTLTVTVLYSVIPV